MAELSGFWTTSGAPAGHQQASYTQSHWSTAASILSACSGFEGVAPGYLNGLTGSYISANHCHIDTGGAVVDGKWYLNDAVAGITIPNAGGGTIRKDRIVLRCTWADFHAELTVLTGDATDFPTLTQTPGTTYDIALYKAQVTDAGVVTLTDERTWASNFAFYRQGGDASNWDSAGTTNYISANTRIQGGANISSAGGDTTITFPIAFSNKPIFLVTPVSSAAVDYYFVHSVSSGTSAIVNFYLVADPASRVAVGFHWLAIGPK